MPSIVAHAVAGAALGSALGPCRVGSRAVLAAAACAALPDIDALGRPFGNLDYEAVFGGHRGITHSIAFALVLGAATTWAFFRDQPRAARLRLVGALAIATASHGILDAFSTIGNGVAFWAPFSWTHYEFNWQPLGQLGQGTGGRERALAIVANELLWVGLPALIVVAVARMSRHHA